MTQRSRILNYHLLEGRNNGDNTAIECEIECVLPLAN
jgi:hypothetical protein